MVSNINELLPVLRHTHDQHATNVSVTSILVTRALAFCGHVVGVNRVALERGYVTSCRYVSRKADPNSPFSMQQIFSTYKAEIDFVTS